MLRSLKPLLGYKVEATDGDIGKVEDFFFDDETWTIRYAVVDTGPLFTGRKVLISTAALDHPDWETHKFPVGLNREQVKNSPDIDVDLPVSRKHEEQLHKYYGWDPYWPTTMYGMNPPIIPPPPQEPEREIEGKRKVEEETHLRSAREVTGYHIHAADGEMGHVEDFIAEDDTWILRYLVVDTRNWLPGRKVLVSVQWATRVSWDERLLYTDLDRETIKKSPEYDPTAPVNRDYEERLYDYYGRKKYWT